MSQDGSDDKTEGRTPLGRRVRVRVEQSVRDCAPALDALTAPTPTEEPSAVADGTPADPYSAVFTRTAPWLAERVERSRQEMRTAERSLERLDELPAADWPAALVELDPPPRAFAVLALAECRRRVRNDPAEAERLAGLVAPLLERAAAAPGRPWAEVLKARATAHRANALRVAGDLGAADHLFVALRREMPAQVRDDLEAQAEIGSLEASLRFDQRRFAEAATLLERAGRLYQRCSNEEGRARVLIQQANLLQEQGREEEALDRLEEESRRLDPQDNTYLYLCTITGRVGALCRLDRYQQASALLESHLSYYAASDDPYALSVLQGLRGRVALGLGDHAEAERAFLACRRGYRELGRDYDVALATLDLAQVLLAEGRSGELEELAADLLHLFSAHRVSRETLASIRLLAEAAAGARLTSAMVDRLRRRLEGDRGDAVLAPVISV